MRPRTRKFPYRARRSIPPRRTLYRCLRHLHRGAGGGPGISGHRGAMNNSDVIPGPALRRSCHNPSSRSILVNPLGSGWIRTWSTSQVWEEALIQLVKTARKRRGASSDRWGKSGCVGRSAAGAVRRHGGSSAAWGKLRAWGSNLSGSGEKLITREGLR